jgi:general secretion pathway protein D
LFRNESRERKKTNLMVFLRPVVLRDSDATETLSTLRYQQMLGVQQSTHQPSTSVLPVSNTMTMPTLPTREPGGSTTSPGAAAPTTLVAPSASTGNAPTPPAR